MSLANFAIHPSIHPSGSVQLSVPLRPYTSRICSFSATCPTHVDGFDSVVGRPTKQYMRFDVVSLVYAITHTQSHTIRRAYIELWDGKNHDRDGICNAHRSTPLAPGRAEATQRFKLTDMQCYDMPAVHISARFFTVLQLPHTESPFVHAIGSGVASPAILKRKFLFRVEMCVGVRCCWQRTPSITCTSHFLAEPPHMFRGGIPHCNNVTSVIFLEFYAIIAFHPKIA